MISKQKHDVTKQASGKTPYDCRRVGEYFHVPEFLTQAVQKGRCEAGECPWLVFVVRDRPEPSMSTRNEDDLSEPIKRNDRLLKSPLMVRRAHHERKKYHFNLMI